MLSLNVSLRNFTLYPGWFKDGSAVNMPYSDRCWKNTQKEGYAETGIKGYHYMYVYDNLKVNVMNFKPAY